MADNKDAGVPALQDPSTSDNVCPTCQGLAIMITNSTTNQCENSDNDDSSLSSVGHLIIHENPASPSDSSDSAYEADTIIDSPNSRSSTLKLNLSDSSNDIVSNVDSNDSHDSEITDMPPLEGSDPEIKDPKWQQRSKGNHTLPPLNQEEKLCVQNGCVCKCHGFKFGKGLSSDSDDTDRCDMPVLQGCDEDEGDKPPLINELSVYIERLHEEKEETKEDSEEDL